MSPYPLFQTVVAAEFPSPPFQGAVEKGVKMWGYVTHDLFVPWFHVAVAEAGDSRVVFASHLATWINLRRGVKTKELRLVDVRLVSPGWINGSADWKMELLTEVWEGREPSSNDKKAHIFVVESGARYVYSGMKTAEQLLLDVKEIYRRSAKTKPARRPATSRANDRTT